MNINWIFHIIKASPSIAGRWSCTAPLFEHMPSYSDAYCQQFQIQTVVLLSLHIVKLRSLFPVFQFYQFLHYNGLKSSICCLSTSGSLPLNHEKGLSFSIQRASSYRSIQSTLLSHWYMDMFKLTLSLRPWEENDSSSVLVSWASLWRAGDCQVQLFERKGFAEFGPILLSLRLNSPRSTPRLGSSKAQSMMIFLMLCW